MKKQQPFMPLFFGDFVAATADWDGEEAALYLLCLGYQWSLGSLPVEADKVCKLVRWDRRLFARMWPQVSAKFVEKDGRLYNDRLEQHRERAAAKSAINAEAGKRGATKRWRTDSERHGESDGETIANATDSPSSSLWRNDGNPTQNQNEEEEKNPAAGAGQGQPVGKSSSFDSGQAQDFESKSPLTPPQDARDFDTIKANVAVLAERFKTTDPEQIRRLGGQAYKLSKRQCEVACQQLREDGFFDRMQVATA